MGEGMDWGVGDGNAEKLGCEDHWTTMNIIKFIELKKRKAAWGQGVDQISPQGPSVSLIPTPSISPP